MEQFSGENNFGQMSAEDENKTEKKLESLHKVEVAHIPADKKLELALLLLDRKKALQFGVFQVAETEDKEREIIDEFEREFIQIKELLDDLHLPYHISKELENRDGIVGFSILVSKDKNTLDEFSKADANNDDETFGRLAGYPESAINTYKTENAFNWANPLPN